MSHLCVAIVEKCHKSVANHHKCHKGCNEVSQMSYLNYDGVNHQWVTFPSVTTKCCTLWNMGEYCHTPQSSKESKKLLGIWNAIIKTCKSGLIVKCHSPEEENLG